MLLNRRRRLGVPAVNQNPQLQGSPALQGPQTQQSGIGVGVGGGHQGPPGGGHHPKPPPKPPGPKPPPKPPGPFQLPVWQGHGPDPRDATYWQNVARLRADALQGYRQNLLSQSYSNTDYSRSQEQLAINQNLDRQGLANDALRSGLSSSGYLNQQTAEQTGSYLLKQGDLTINKGREDSARLAARKALQQGYSMDAAAELAQAAARAADAARTTAQQGNPVLTKKALKKLLDKGGKHGHHGGNH